MGGFLIFIGVVLLGVFAFVMIGVFDVNVIEGIMEIEGYRILFLGVLFVIGVLDVVSGLLLRR
jgi:hypothetical protein